MTRARALGALLLLAVLATTVQLLGDRLGALRPPPPPTLFQNAAQLIDRRAPSAGPADAAVTIILFSDYRCPACRAMHADLQEVVARRRDVRIVYRDWPIFGAPSLRAARLAIASTHQNRHAAFDDALMRSARLDEAGLQAAAAQAGVDWPRLEADLARHGAEIDALIADTRSRAQAMGLVGTPTTLIGPLLVVGRIDAERLTALIEQARGGG